MTDKPAVGKRPLKKTAKKSSLEQDDDQELSLSPQKLFWLLVGAWTILLLAATLSSYFLLPLLGVTTLVPIATSLVGVGGPTVSLFLHLCSCLVVALCLSTTAFYKPLTENLTTNFNFFHWKHIFLQIWINAYKNAGTAKSVSPWQAFNFIAHFYLLIGSMQFLVNKIFHQLYNQKIVYDGMAKNKLTPPHFLSNKALLIPRILLVFPLLLIMLPLNLLGTVLEQINYGIYRGIWFLTDYKGYSKAKMDNAHHGTSIKAKAQERLAVTTVDWVLSPSQQEREPNRKRKRSISLGAQTHHVNNPYRGAVPKASTTTGEATKPPVTLKIKPHFASDSADVDGDTRVTAPPSGTPGSFFSQMPNSVARVMPSMRQASSAESDVYDAEAAEEGMWPRYEIGYQSDT